MNKPTGQAPCKNSCEAQSFYIEIRSLKAAVKRLRKDKKRLDWLASTTQIIGNVTLPKECVENNLSSLRDAIDDAMLLKR